MSARNIRLWLAGSLATSALAMSVAHAQPEEAEVAQRTEQRREAEQLKAEGTHAASIADFETSAVAYEMYARRFAGNEDAPRLLLRAIRYRQALGHHRKMAMATDVFIAHYARKQPVVAANLVFTLAEYYEEQGEARKAAKTLKRYVSDFGKSGGDDRILVASAKLGEILWKQSCPLTSSDGLCLRPRRRQRLKTDCTPAAYVGLEVVARNPRLAREALRYFGAALKLAPRRAFGGSSEGRAATAVYWTAGARMRKADEAYERFLARKRAKGVNAEQWLRASERDLQRLIRMYEGVRAITGGGAAWAVAAAARVGQISEHVSNEILETRPASGLPSDDHCHSLVAKSQPIADLAVGAYGFCINLSTKLNWFDGSSRLCERRLGVLRPGDFPMARERRGSSSAPDAQLSAESLQAEGEL